MYRRCPYQYFCRYIKGLKIPPGSAFVVGQAFDSAINLEYKTKIEKDKGQKSSVIQDCFAEMFDKQKHNAIWQQDEKPEKIKDLGINCTKHFHQKVCPTVQPAKVQERSSLTFENVDYDFLVVVDLITKDGLIVDNKSAKRSWTDTRYLSELDPVCYSLLYELTQGKKEKGFRFDIGVYTKSPKIQQFERIVSKEEKEGFLKMISYVHDSIESDIKRGMMLPITDHFLCSKKWCGYWQICEKEWGHKIKE